MCCFHFTCLFRIELSQWLFLSRVARRAAKIDENCFTFQCMVWNTAFLVRIKITRAYKVTHNGYKGKVSGLMH